MYIVSVRSDVRVIDCSRCMHRRGLLTRRRLRPNRQRPRCCCCIFAAATAAAIFASAAAAIFAKW